MQGIQCMLFKMNNMQKRIVEEVRKERKIQETTKKTISLESLSDQFKHEDLKELNLILRADSKGSVDALRDSLLKLSNDEVAILRDRKSVV